MEKLKNTPQYIKPFVLLFALLWGSSVMGQTTYTNNSGADTTGVVPNLSSSNTVTCGENLTITYTLTPSDFAELQYKDDDLNWQPVGTTPATVSISSTTLDLQVYVTNLPDDETVTLEIESITEPDPLSFTLSSSETVFCTANSGDITVSVTGGTPDYTVNITGPSSYDETDTGDGSSDFTFTNLAAGEYTISVSDDASTCPDPVDQTYTVHIDTEAPTGCVEPDDFTMLLSDYLALDSTYLLISESSSTPYNFVPGDPDTILYEYDVSGYNKMYFDFEVTQNGSSWDENDVISFYVDYIEDASIDGDLLYESTGEYQEPNTEPNIDSLRLPALADNVGTLYLYIVYEAGDGNSYTISDVTLVGNSMTETIETSTSIEPFNCTDNYTADGDIRITHEDGIIHWVCNEEGNREFWFIRTYTISDDCENSDTYEQKIGVGTAPVIVAPNDTIIDYCKLENVSIPVPEHSDNSETCGGSVTVDYIVYKENNDEVTSGTASGETISLDNDLSSSDNQDTTFVINWIVTDEAGLSTSTNQNVTILKPITIKLTPDKTDFCSGEEVSFEFTIDGGTGSYGTVQLTSPSGETLSQSGNTYSFTTSSLVLGVTENITINVTDSDVSNYEGGIYSVQGGCFVTITFENGVANGNGIPFTIHENISTNELERVE